MFEASMNIDISTMKPMLERILVIFDDNFDESHALQLVTIAESTPENDKEMVSLKVTYNDIEHDLVYVVKNDGGSLSMFFFSENEEITNNISTVQRDYSEKIGI
jgi:hypothetical protein